MNTQDCIATKLDIREFSKENVPSNIISTILNSARYSGSGLNTQHWRFIVIKEKNNLKKLSEDRYKWTMDNWSKFCYYNINKSKVWFSST